MQGYCPKIHFRCRMSSFREVSNELVEKFGEQFVRSLRDVLSLINFLVPSFQKTRYKFLKNSIPFY
ncbi:hypothetical protein KFK09_025133 [Dendrobium nobile]|uniref:Uncharacterized protein n=1 Tax=Dendrobium nobile TaxID=94219 RepID=A0A8T3AF96_DENNO|nr:hypothetical protein KFK09_025133 [Dendrobium nobile]